MFLTQRIPTVHFASKSIVIGICSFYDFLRSIVISRHKSILTRFFIQAPIIIFFARSFHPPPRILGIIVDPPILGSSFWIQGITLTRNHIVQSTEEAITRIVNSIRPTFIHYASSRSFLYNRQTSVTWDFNPPPSILSIRIYPAILRTTFWIQGIALSIFHILKSTSENLIRSICLIRTRNKDSINNFRRAT